MQGSGDSHSCARERFPGREYISSFPPPDARTKRGHKSLDHPYGNRVPDLRGNLAASSFETVTVIEGLQAGNLAECHRPIIFRVSKPSSCHIRTACCQRRGYIIPSHSPINVRVSRIVLVAWKNKFFRQ